jgi:putative ABC transport system substrate-binding protein
LLMPRARSGGESPVLDMRRREFITLLGGAAATWPLAAGAQQGRLPTIGFLGTATPSTQSSRVGAFVQRLRELGWIENRTVAIEYRWAEGRPERFAEIAAEFVRLKVDVIVTSGTPVVIAAKQATAAIPIVFVTVTDPVGSGLVGSLAQPGGNVTGLSLQSPDIAGKRLALLREVVPNLRRVAFMGNIDNPFVLREMREFQAAADTLALEAIMSEIRQPQDIVPAFDALKHRADAIYLASEGLVDANRFRINILALGARLPTTWSQQELVEAGGLMSYGPSFLDQFRRAGDFVDKILRGAKPADIPIEQPIKFDLVVNLIVAKALGLEIPPSILARADEVIE